tara:strand:+ start:711 stop:1031 length:321 start_codon:yes stop_codon:yes gene_type:complete
MTDLAPILPALSTLLACYGIVFMLRYRMPFLRGKIGLLDKLLDCPYCTGFHVGWVFFLLHFAALSIDYQTPILFMIGFITWGFSSAAVSYILYLASPDDDDGYDEE